MRRINTDIRLNYVTIDLVLLLAPKCVEQQDLVSSSFVHVSSFRTLQLIFILFTCRIFFWHIRLGFYLLGSLRAYIEKTAVGFS